MFCFVRFYLPCAVIPPAIPPTAQTAAAQKSSGSGKSARQEDCGDDDQNGKIHDSKADAPEKPPFFPPCFLPSFRRKSLMPDRSPQCPPAPSFPSRKISRAGKTAAKKKHRDQIGNEKSLQPADPAARTHRPCFLFFHKKSPPIL